MPTYQNNKQGKHYIKVLKILWKNILRQIKNFRRNTGDLKNSKHNLKYNFTFWKDAGQQKEQVFVIYV